MPDLTPQQAVEALRLHLRTGVGDISAAVLVAVLAELDAADGRARTLAGDLANAVADNQRLRNDNQRLTDALEAARAAADYFAAELDRVAGQAKAATGD